MSHLMTSLWRLEHERFYISFSLADSYDKATGKWVNGIWPCLFHSREAAELVVEKFPVFANAAAVPGRGRIKSCYIETILVK